MNIYRSDPPPARDREGRRQEGQRAHAVLRSAADANKTQVKQAVEKLFKVKVAEVRTANFEGKLRRRGRFTGYRSDWKKAYVKLKAGREGARVRGDLETPCRSKHSDRQRRPAASRPWCHARGHHQGHAGEVAGRRQEAHRRPQQHRPRDLAASSAAAHKQAYRVIDFKRDKDGIPAKVAAIEYDPNRSRAHRAAALRGRREALHHLRPTG